MDDRDLHKPARPQSWPTADDDLRNWVTDLVNTLARELGDELVGVYLHGSLAMGCYYKPKSDFDTLVVVRARLPVDVRRRLAEVFLAAQDNRPTTGGLEVSVVTEEAARQFVHPMPYEVHFSSSWVERVRRNEVDYGEERSDPDLAAHVTVVHARGISLIGPPAKEVFGVVPFVEYVAAINDDFDWIVEDDNLLTSPFYGVLNACRVLMVLKLGPGCAPSKEEAAEWALRELPMQQRVAVEQALLCYRSGSAVGESERQRHGHAWDAHALRSFRDYARKARESL